MRKRVLVVEDDASVALLIKDGMVDLGATFSVEIAPSGEAALAKIQQGKWDVIVTDLRLTGISGLELIEKIHRHLPNALTILMTGFGSEEIERAAQQLDVYRYLTKPFPLTHFKRIIEEALAPSPNDKLPTRVRELPTPILKITLSGDGNVGKTTLIKRLCTGRFEASRVMTIGVDFHLYDIQNDNQPARLIVWDVSGQDQFTFTRRAFYRGSKAVGLVYAVNDRASFERLPMWRDEIHSILPNIPVVLAGNKSDLERCVSVEEGQAVARAWDIPFIETSCVSGDGVESFFNRLAQVALHNVQR